MRNQLIDIKLIFYKVHIVGYQFVYPRTVAINYNIQRLCCTNLALDAYLVISFQNE